MNSSPVLECHDIAFERDDVPLFESVSFRVPEGYALQVAGPNGTGKTTLLRICATALIPSAGELHHGGQPLSRCRQQYRMNSLFLGHDAAVKGGLTPRENLAWFFWLYPGNGRNPDEALALVGLAGYEDAPCHTLSAGQLRRVALARLYISTARLWILDEPFTAVDAAGVAQLERLMGRHMEEGGSVLLTTHQRLALAHVDILNLENYVSVS